MDVLRTALDIEPESWERKSAESYNNSYLLFTIYGYEYEKVVEDSDIDITHGSINIQRIQNPVQWGLFKIQEEKRRNEGSSVNERIGYHVIHTNDLNTAMKYPLDYRRYNNRNAGVQSDYNKHPRFYDTFSDALQTKNVLSDAEGKFYIIKCKYFYPLKNQGDYYPLYVIRV